MPNDEVGLRGKAWVKATLIENADKNFVQRLFKTDSPQMDIGDGRIATHQMGWANIGGGEGSGGGMKTIVYPNIIQEKDKSLVWLPAREATQHAEDTGEYIEVGSPEDAEELSTKYKEVLPNFDGRGTPGTGGPGSKSTENPNSEAYKIMMKMNKRKLGLITGPAKNGK
jgi:hypothetical protein